MHFFGLVSATYPQRDSKSIIQKKNYIAHTDIDVLSLCFRFKYASDGTSISFSDWYHRQSDGNCVTVFAYYAYNESTLVNPLGFGYKWRVFDCDNWHIPFVCEATPQ